MAKYEFTPQDDSETDGFVHGTIVVTFDNPKYQELDDVEVEVPNKNDSGTHTETQPAYNPEPKQHRFEQVVVLPKDFDKKAQEYADDYEKSFNESQEK